MEPKPGIMPTPNHLADLIQVIRSGDIKVVAMEPYFSPKAPNFLNEKTGIKVVKVAQSVGAVPQADNYIDMIEYDLKTLSDSLGD